MRHFAKQRRVNKVADYLDRIEPGWADKIDLGTLNLLDGDACILGQIYADRGGYFMNVHRFALAGFSPFVFTNDGYHGAWVRAILKRQTPKLPLFFPKEWEKEREHELV